MYDPSDPEQYQAVKSCVARMMHRAIEMDGTVSVSHPSQRLLAATLTCYQGEHGIGLGKKVSRCHLV